MITSRLIFSKTFWLGLGLLLVLLTGWTGMTYAAPPADEPGQTLFTDTNQKGSMDTRNDPTIVRAKFVTINFDLVGGTGKTGALPQRTSGETVELSLFDEVKLTAVLDRIEPVAGSGYAWIGQLKGNPLGRVVLVVKDGLMAGNIAMPGGFYQVRYSQLEGTM